jgi:hypothetical protein
LPREKRKDMIKKTRVKVFKPNGDFVVKTKLYIDLKESQNYVLLELAGSLVLESDPDYALAQQKNERYLQVHI